LFKGEFELKFEADGRILLRPLDEIKLDAGGGEADDGGGACSHCSDGDGTGSYGSSESDDGGSGWESFWSGARGL
jgi:hypothetical protein